MPKLGIWAQTLKNKRQQKIPDFPRFEILGHLIVFLGPFGWFWVVPAGFSSFWLVSGCFGSSGF